MANGHHGQNGHNVNYWGLTDWEMTAGAGRVHVITPSLGSGVETVWETQLK